MSSQLSVVSCRNMCAALEVLTTSLLGTFASQQSINCYWCFSLTTAPQSTSAHSESKLGCVAPNRSYAEAKQTDRRPYPKVRHRWCFFMQNHQNRQLDSAWWFLKFLLPHILRAAVLAEFCCRTTDHRAERSISIWKRLLVQALRITSAGR